MIPDQWYAVIETRELKKEKTVHVTRFGRGLVFWRDRAGEIHCLEDKCAHRGAQLSEGRACSHHRDQIECPFHGFRYDRSGQCTRIPAQGKKGDVPPRFRVQAYITREAHGFIWLWWGEPRETYPPLPFFEDIDAKFTYKTYSEIWPVHYTRAIENQLDVVHLPFVHKTTIGRGNQTLVHGPLVEPVNGDPNDFRVWVLNQRDDGKTIPRKPEDFTNADKVFHIRFKFPHLWENFISEKLRIFIAFVPYDDEHTLFYMRFYQKFIRVPGLRRFVNWLGIKFSNIILHQDRSVVITQRPIQTSYLMNEQLIQGDRPIIYYRKRRAELLGNFITPTPDEN